MIDKDELRAAFQTTAAQMPEDLELIGVTLHGPGVHQEWMAFAQRNGDPSAGCESWAGTPRSRPWPTCCAM